MKKCFYVMTALLVGLTSCTSEDEPIKATTGEATPVSFSVALPDYGPQSRVTEDEANIPGKGKKINAVQYAIYDAADNLVVASDRKEAPQAQKDPEDHGHFTLEVDLLKNHTYKVYMWASAETVETTTVDGQLVTTVTYTSPYTFDPAQRTVKVDYSKVRPNDETMDAFFGYHQFTIANEQTADDQYSVILNRPFAQLNIMTNDNTLAENLEKTGTIKSTEVTVEGPGTYDMLGLTNYKASSSNPNNTSFTFVAEYPNGWDDLVHAGDGDVAKYYYLATCYLLTGIDPDGSLNGLVGAAKEVTNITIKINYTDNTSITITKPNIPIRRSWRTNIWGSLETTTASVNCRIDFNFDGTYGDGPGANGGSEGPDDGDHSGDDNSNNETID